MAEVVVKDNSEKVLKEFNTKIGVALNLMGAAGSRHVGKRTPRRTGNLASSVTWKVDDRESLVTIGFSNAEAKDKPVDYAKYVEFGSIHNKPVHMLQNGIEDSKEEFKKIVERILKQG